MAKFISFVLCATLAGLFYVYGETEAVKIGYTIRKQEEIRTQALDRSRALKYNIARLKAPHNLERRLMAQHIMLESPKSWQTLALSSGLSVKRPALAGISMTNRPPFFSRFFVGTAQAEAKEPSNR